MSFSSFDEIIILIDEWVEQLEDWELNDKCRTSGKSFFDFLKRRNLNVSVVAKIIQDCTGYNPRQLCTVKDADLLRHAIRAYESEQAEIEHFNINTTDRLKKSTRHWFKGE